MKSKLLIITITSLTSLALAADKDKEHPNSPDNQAATIIKNCDADGNGTISKKEFRKSRICKDITKKHGSDEVEKAFSRADNNKDGELSKSELARMDHGKGKHDDKKHRKGKGKKGK